MFRQIIDGRQYVYDYNEDEFISDNQYDQEKAKFDEYLSDLQGS